MTQHAGTFVKYYFSEECWVVKRTLPDKQNEIYRHALRKKKVLKSWNDRDAYDVTEIFNENKCFLEK